MNSLQCDCINNKKALTWDRTVPTILAQKLKQPKKFHARWRAPVHTTNVSEATLRTCWLLHMFDLCCSTCHWILNMFNFFRLVAETARIIWLVAYDMLLHGVDGLWHLSFYDRELWLMTSTFEFDLGTGVKMNQTLITQCLKKVYHPTTNDNFNSSTGFEIQNYISRTHEMKNRIGLLSKK